MKKILILISIIILAFFLRFYQLDKVPPSLNWDEVSHGYNAYSILKTGKDEWGIKFPLIFRAYGDFKLPLYIYLTAVSEFFFGINTFSVRFVSILSGVGLVLMAFLITKQITKNDKYSLTAAFLTAITPWGLFLSRVAVEANLGAFLFVIGIYFLMLWLEKFNWKTLLLTAVFWGLSIHAYNSARVIVPVFIILIIIFASLKKKIIQVIPFLILLVVFFTPILSQLINNTGSARFENVSLIDQGTVNKIIGLRSNSKMPSFLPRLIYNRPAFFVYYSARNYFSNLSPNYLFFKGGSHYQFSFPSHELLFLVSAPFLIVGLIIIIFRKKKWSELLIVIWFLVSFIPSAITKDAPHVLRSVFVLPSPMILSIIGLKFIADFLEKHKSKTKGNLLLGVFIFSIIISFSKWWNEYLTLYPKVYSWAWQFGYKEAVKYSKENYSSYDKILVTKRLGEPHEFFLFYFPWEPSKYLVDPDKKWDYHSQWYWVDGFDKFIFLNDWEVVEKVKDQVSKRVKGEKFLLVTSPGNYPKGGEKIKTINLLDGTPTLEFVEFK